tara:strand:+ start:427 stop:609 length:183 start_codon:yes stop_codon:yes gene_type:complete
MNLCHVTPLFLKNIKQHKKVLKQKQLYLTLFNFISLLLVINGAVWHKKSVLQFVIFKILF